MENPKTGQLAPCTRTVRNVKRWNLLFVKESNFGTIPTDHHRTQGRLNSRVPVAIEWAEGAQQARVEGKTLDVSPKGCLVSVARRFAPQQALRLMNLANQNSCKAVAVWCRNEGGHEWVVGVELQEPGLEFWGLEL
jgi:hypothetical protein